MWPRIPSLCSILLAASMLAACESDYDPTVPRPRPTRALQSPFGQGSPQTEAVSTPPGTVPLFTMNFPNAKGEKPEYKTFLDPLMQPSSQPARSPAHPTTSPAEPAPPLIIIQSRKPADQYQVAHEPDGSLILTITCSSGIGSAIVERTDERWPAALIIRLRYTSDKRFTNLEGFTAQEIVNDDQQLNLKVAITKADGTAEIRIPAFVRSKRISLEWVDAYR